MAQAKSKVIPTKESEEAQTRMSFGEHLEELRKRIISALLGSIAGVVLCVYFYRTIVDIVARPYQLVARAHHLPDFLNTLKPQEAFLTSITLAFQAGLLLSSPWIIYQIWQFVAAGLFPRERKIVYRYTAPSAFLFLTGVAFFYFMVLPMTLNFFMGFTADTAGPPPTPNWIERIMGIGEGTPVEGGSTVTPATASSQAASQAATQGATQPAAQAAPLPILNADPPTPARGQAAIYMDSRDGRVKIRTFEGIFILSVTQEGALFSTQWRYDDYLSFVTFTALIFGLAFELPMVIMILAQVGIVQVKTFRGIRKYAYFAIVAVSAVAAPSGDIMTLMFLTVPLVFLYEMGIIVAAIVVGRRERADAAK